MPTEDDAPTREQISIEMSRVPNTFHTEKEVRNNARIEIVKEFLASYSSEIRDKVLQDLKSYPEWEH